MAAEQTPLTWLLRKRTPGDLWSEWIVCGKADFDAIKAKPLHWGLEYEAVEVIERTPGVSPSGDQTFPRHPPMPSTEKNDG